MSDRIREQVMEEARQAVWAILAVGELIGSHGIHEATLRRVAPDLLLSPAAVRLAATLASACLGQIEVVSMILAGGYDEASIAALEAEISRDQYRRPVPRARRRARPVAGAVMMEAAANPQLALEPPAAPVAPPPAAQGAPEGPDAP